MFPYENHLKSFARRLRTNMTDAERKLWLHLRGKQIAGVQFYRQKPLGDYIVDFYAPSIGLVIEVDGSQHFDTAVKQQDEIRDAWLWQQGLVVLRFDNFQVLQETDAVLEAIAPMVEERVVNGRC